VPNGPNDFLREERYRVTIRIDPSARTFALGYTPSGNSKPRCSATRIVEKDRRLADAVDLRIELDAVISDDGAIVGSDRQSWLSEMFRRACDTAGLETALPERTCGKGEPPASDL
jgi:hypothetical protein